MFSSFFSQIYGHAGGLRSVCTSGVVARKTPRIKTDSVYVCRNITRGSTITFLRPDRVHTTSLIKNKTIPSKFFFFLDFKRENRII